VNKKLAQHESSNSSTRDLIPICLNRSQFCSGFFFTTMASGVILEVLKQKFAQLQQISPSEVWQSLSAQTMKVQVLQETNS
jgi:hypothetical protein